MPRVTKSPAATPVTPTAPKRRVSATPGPVEVFVEVSADEIAHEAYALYLERGGSNGDANSDWLEAERRVRERRINQASAAKPAAARRRASSTAH